MKTIKFRLAILSFLGCFIISAPAQGVSVNATGAQPDPSAMMDVSSTTKGTLITRMTSGQRDLIVTPAKGLLIYNTDCDNIQCNTGTPLAPNWTSVFPSADLPPTPGTINGANSVCAGSSGKIYYINTVSGATGYKWTVSSPGASIASTTTPDTSITVNFGSNPTGIISVSDSNGCGTSTVSILSISPNSIPSSPGTISGTISECPNAASQLYYINTVNGATGYKWTFPSGASITSATTPDTSITVTFGSNPAGSVAVSDTNACGASSQGTPLSVTKATICSPDTFNYTGAFQTFTVPAGIDTITVTVYGAQGGNAVNGENGGTGGMATGKLVVTPGQVIYINVGQQGLSTAANTGSSSYTTSQNWGQSDYGGQGYGGNNNATGAAGGGASDIRITSTAFSNAVIIAGGGGGACFFDYNGIGCGSGGQGGGLTGGNGTQDCNFINSTYVGTGATQNAAGTGGGYTATNCGTCNVGNGASNASGGNGGMACSLAFQGNAGCLQYCAAGGGGGYYGGGAGWGSAGGGGGSGYINAAHINGGSMSGSANSGNGMVIISWY